MRNADSQSETLADATGAGRNPVDPELLDLFVFEAGSRIFAVPVDQVEGTTEAKVPAGLPQLPQAPPGAVCPPGPKLTRLHPTGILTGQPRRLPPTLPSVV